MANYLILNRNQVFNGLGTLTYSVVSTEAYNVQVQVTFPQAQPINSSLVSDAGDAGYVGAGSGMGLGSGTGGGDQGFVLGDRGTTYGGKGLGFGTGNNYQQPPSAGSNETRASATTSQLSIVVNNNGSPIYTSVAPTAGQSGYQFKTSFLATSGDSITVVLSSSAASDNQLSGVTSNVSISQGL